jgi:transcriptional regulator with XRE-family HTH domain
MEQEQNEQPDGEDGWFSNVGATLRALRHLRKLSQLELAQKAGLSQVVTYETGRASPSLKTLSRLLDALAINPIVFAYALRRSRPASGLRFSWRRGQARGPAPTKSRYAQPGSLLRGRRRGRLE